MGGSAFAVRIDKMALLQQCSASRRLDRSHGTQTRRQHTATPHSTGVLVQRVGRRRPQAVSPQRRARGPHQLSSSASSEAATATLQAPGGAAEVKAVLFDMVGGLGGQVGIGLRVQRCVVGILRDHASRVRRLGLCTDYTVHNEKGLPA